MGSQRNQIALRAAQITAVTFSLSVLTYLVIHAQQQHNPDPAGGTPDSTAPGGHPAAANSAPANKGTDSEVFLPTSKSLVMDPAFLSTSKSIVLNTATSGAESEAFLFSSKSAVLPEGLVQGHMPQVDKKQPPVFLPSSKSEVFLFSSKSAVLPEIPVFLPSSKSLAPQPKTPKVESTSKTGASNKSKPKQDQSKNKPGPKR